MGGVARRPAEFARDLCVRYHHGYVAQHHTAIRRDESGAFRGGPVVWGRSRSQRCRYPNHEKWPGCHRRYSRGALRPPTTLRRGGRTGGRSRGCPRPGTLAVRRFAVPGVRIAFASAMSERRIGALFNAVTRRPRSRTPAVTGTTPSRLSHSAPLSVRLTPSTACPRGRTPDDRKPENSACSSDENPHSLGAGFAQVIVISRIRWSRPAPSRALPPPLRFAWPVPGPGRSLPLHRAT